MPGQHLRFTLQNIPDGSKTVQKSPKNSKSARNVQTSKILDFFQAQMTLTIKLDQKQNPRKSPPQIFVQIKSNPNDIEYNSSRNQIKAKSYTICQNTNSNRIDIK